MMEVGVLSGCRPKRGLLPTSYKGCAPTSRARVLCRGGDGAILLYGVELLLQL